MVEDNLANLKTAHRLGLRTVWIAGPDEKGYPGHVHLRVNSVLKLTTQLTKHCLPTLNR